MYMYMNIYISKCIKSFINKFLVYLFIYLILSLTHQDGRMFLKIHPVGWMFSVEQLCFDSTECSGITDDLSHFTNLTQD